MRQQEATTIVSLPLATAERRLRDVESWPLFLHDIGSIRCTSHERYVFTLNEGRNRREIKMVVRLRYREHCFVWHPITGPAVRGQLKLTAVDAGHTAVRLRMSTLPGGVAANLAEMLMPGGSAAKIDLQRLERHLLHDFATEP
jgi:hypothetical protein